MDTEPFLPKFRIQELQNIMSILLFPSQHMPPVLLQDLEQRTCVILDNLNSAAVLLKTRVVIYTQGKNL